MFQNPLYLYAYIHYTVHNFYSIVLKVLGFINHKTKTSVKKLSKTKSIEVNSAVAIIEYSCGYC